MKRKGELMRDLFGVGDGICKNCCHYTTYMASGTPVRKCSVYGMTASKASDWKASEVACGLFNKPYEGDVPIIRIVTRERLSEQIEGQMELFGEEVR